MEKKKKPYFPMFIDLSDKKVIVIGAGTIAKRRIRSLIQFTDHLYVIAPEVNNELLELEKEGKLTILKKKYESADICDADMIIAATNDHQINNKIYSFCKCRGIVVNVCSDKEKCDFYFPGIARSGQIIAGITASGTDHRKAKVVAEKIQTVLKEQDSI